VVQEEQLLSPRHEQTEETNTFMSPDNWSVPVPPPSTVSSKSSKTPQPEFQW
jgi:hypothetical protein